MAKKTSQAKIANLESIPAKADVPLWDLDVTELSGRTIETSGRNDVNHVLTSGWVLLHIYTLKYRDGSTWRERPMAILGKRVQRQR